MRLTDEEKKALLEVFLKRKEKEREKERDERIQLNNEDKRKI